MALAVALCMQAPSARADPGSDEIAATRRVCEVGPAAAMARALRLRGASAVVAAGVLPNPDLVLQHQRGVVGAEDQETIVGISVPLGIGGRRSLLQDAARARSEAARADASASLFDQALSYREARSAVAVDEARLSVLEAQQRALDALTGTIEALARAGEAAGLDLLRQQTQARVHRRAVESARASAAASRAMLDAWGIEGAPLPAARLDTLAGGADVLRRARSASPEPPRLRSLQAASKASAIEAQAARRRWVPDVDVFAGYRATLDAASEAGHGVSVGLTLPLTFFDHGQGEAAQADAERAAADASAEQLRRAMGAGAKAATQRLEILEASMAEIDRAADDATALEDQAARLYAAGELSMAEVLDAFRGAEEARLAAIASAEEIVHARLSLMRARGSLFDAGLDKACGLTDGAPR